jgi:hypothetical protein
LALLEPVQPVLVAAVSQTALLLVMALSASSSLSQEYLVALV